MFNSSRKRVVIIFFGLCFLIMVFLVMGLGLFFLSPAKKGGADQVIVVKEGLSLAEVASELERRKIITDKTLFMLWARLMGYSRKIKAGEYRLSPDMPPTRILEKLTRGAIITHPVTIPEGFTREQIAGLLKIEGLVNKKEFLSLTEDPAILRQYGVPGQTLEGYLYPDTYQFARGISAETAIGAMVRRFWQIFGPLGERVKEVGMNMNEVVILASIVEK
ncbi:MAG: endolytic transglycosylase MltG, partial [Desulfatiglandales bacterium]